MTDQDNNLELLSFADKRRGDSWVDPDGCHWDDPAEYIHSHLLGFCGCGTPEDSLEHVMKGLSHIDELSVEKYDEWVKRGHEVFGNEQSRYFFFYWADKEELTEHGGSVPGWLTEKGKNMLSDLRLLKDAGLIS